MTCWLTSSTFIEISLPSLKKNQRKLFENSRSYQRLSALSQVVCWALKIICIEHRIGARKQWGRDAKSHEKLNCTIKDRDLANRFPMALSVPGLFPVNEAVVFQKKKRWKKPRLSSLNSFLFIAVLKSI